MEYQVLFWEQAAGDWDRYQKSNKRNECLAAAAALKAFLPLFPAPKTARVRTPKGAPATDGATTAGKASTKRQKAIVHDGPKSVIPA